MTEETTELIIDTRTKNAISKLAEFLKLSIQFDDAFRKYTKDTSATSFNSYDAYDSGFFAMRHYVNYHQELLDTYKDDKQIFDNNSFPAHYNDNQKEYFLQTITRKSMEYKHCFIQLVTSTSIHDIKSRIKQLKKIKEMIEFTMNLLLKK